MYIWNIYTFNLHYKQAGIVELIIGGAYNSKLNFALKYYNLKQEDFQNGAECDLNTAFSKKGIYNLHLLIRRFIISGIDDYNKIIEKILSSNIEIIICNEVGNGVVPLDKIDSQMREYVGRILCLLSEKSTRVIRIYYGIPSVIKGMDIWKRFTLSVMVKQNIM